MVSLKQGDKGPKKIKELYLVSLIDTDNNVLPKKDIPIVDALDLIIEKKKNQLKPNTLKGYQTLTYHLQKFIVSKHNTQNRKWRISELTREFFDQFHNYLVEDSGLNSDGSLNNQIKYLKSTYHNQEELEYPVNSAVSKFPRKKRPKPNLIIYLYHDELEKIVQVKIDNLLTAKQRDVFVLHCLRRSL